MNEDNGWDWFAQAPEKSFEVQQMELLVQLLASEQSEIFYDRNMGDPRIVLAADVSWSDRKVPVAYATRDFFKVDYEKGV